VAMSASFFELALKKAPYSLSHLGQRRQLRRSSNAGRDCQCESGGFLQTEIQPNRTCAILKACELGDLGLIAVKAFHPADLGDDASGQNRSKARNGSSVLGMVSIWLGDSCFQGVCSGLRDC